MAKKKQAQAIMEERKVAKKKEPIKKLQFPKIPRFIPELPSFFKLKKIHISMQQGIVMLLVVLTLILNWFALKSLYEVGKQWVALQSQRMQIRQRMQLWANITKEYPNYRDAYFEGAVLAYRLGDMKTENQFLSKLQLIDPNFPLTQGLEKLQKVE